MYAYICCYWFLDLPLWCSHMILFMYLRSMNYISICLTCLGNTRYAYFKDFLWIFLSNSVHVLAQLTTENRHFYYGHFWSKRHIHHSILLVLYLSVWVCAHTLVYVLGGVYVWERIESKEGTICKLQLELLPSSVESVLKYLM